MARMLWTWTASDPLARFRSAVDRLFETYGEGEMPWRDVWGTEAYPRMAAEDRGDRVVFEAEVPGVRMEDLEVSCLERTLMVKGERRDADGAEESYERRERPAGKFLRTVELPMDLDAGRTEATLADGVLRISIPKAERAGPRRIEIRPSARTAGAARAAEPAAKTKEEK